MDLIFVPGVFLSLSMMRGQRQRSRRQQTKICPKIWFILIFFLLLFREPFSHIPEETIEEVQAPLGSGYHEAGSEDHEVG